MKIIIDHLEKKIRKKVILDEINCSLDNHIYGLMGPNGSGKTTLIRCILKIMKESKGKVEFFDDENNKLLISHLQIGYLPQNFDAFKDLTVKEQMDYFMILKNIPKSKFEEECDKVLKLVHLYDKKNVRCGNLSGGMVRRVGIAQALLGNPQLIIFDEPTAGLDPDERVNFKIILKKINLNIPIVLSTHLIEDINSLCSHAIFINVGKIVKIGKIDDLLQSLENKVYVCQQKDEWKIKEKVLVRQINENQIRIISNKLLNDEHFTKVEPELDDLYQYIIHGDEIE